jgi:tRNA (guanine37-N1)-methyltransferase
MSRGVREELRGVIPGDLLDLVQRSFDIVGSKQKAVAIIEVPEELRDYKGAIAHALMRVQKNVASVLSKESGRAGEFRTREMRLIAGDPDTEVLHRESGCAFRLDPKTVYFSPRESQERGRIAEATGDGDEVLVMFSGVGPLPIRIAKHRPGVRATAIELNPYAHNYCVENIYLNRVGDRVEAVLGDVREVAETLGRRYDRILMPLPKGAHMFLDVAVPLLRDGGVLHFYHWAPSEDMFGKAEELVKAAFREEGREAVVTERVKVSQYSPRYWKVRIDAVG